MNTSSTIHSVSRLFVIAAIGAGPAWVRAEVIRQGATTELRVASEKGQSTIDYARAIPLELPGVSVRGASEIQADLMGALNASEPAGIPGFSPGARGNGKKNPMLLPKGEIPSADGVAPQEFGTTNHPFSTARNDAPTTTNTSYPSRASGKLFFNIGSSTYVCSASLIKRGLVVTAAHCVANFGKNQYFTNWQFIPGYRNGAAPYGTWNAASARVLTSYLNGTDPCAVSGVVCQSDVAVLTLQAKNSTYAGTSTGWYGYGYNGYGLTSGQMTQITQIGYPVCLDKGLYQERNDSYGYVSSANSNNTVIGSLMCGGSSGGPWLVNFGVRPTLNGTTAGTAADANIVTGVTSWGYTSAGPKEMGASPFTSGNIKTLVDAACAATAAACL